MDKTRLTSTLAAALCLLALVPVQAQKTPKILKTPEQTQKFERLHPSTPTAVVQRRSSAQTRSSTVSAEPYTRGSDTGVIRRPGSTPGPQRSGRGGETTIINPSRPGSTISPEPYRRDGGRGDYRYEGSGRAYGVPQRHHDGGGDHHGHGGYDGYYWYGWGWGPSWGWSFGYRDPFGFDVLAVPYPVPGPTVYYASPQVEYAPQPYPAPGSTEVVPVTPPEQLPLLGCDIVAGDGTFLGVIDKEYNSAQSIANRNGQFGSRTSAVSIWNPASPYGSPTGRYSPWDENAEQPPMLAWHGAFKGYLTNNPRIEPRVSPDALAEVIEAAPWR